MIHRAPTPDGIHRPWCAMVRGEALTCTCLTKSEVAHRDHGVTWIQDAQSDDGWYAQMDSFTAIGSDGREHGLTLTGSPVAAAWQLIREAQIKAGMKALEMRMREQGVWNDGDR